MEKAKTKENKNFGIKMTEETFEKLNALCKETGQTKTAVIEIAIQNYIDDYEELFKKLNHGK